MTAAESSQAICSITDSHTQSPLKIALLGYRSHPYVGGQGIYLKYLSRALAEVGHHVDVYSSPPYPQLDANIRLFKIPSLNLYEKKNHLTALRWKHVLSLTDFREWWSMASGGFGEPRAFGRRIVKHLKHADYDVVHDNQSLCYGLLELQKQGKTVVSTIHHPVHLDRDLALAEQDTWYMRILIRRWYSFIRMQEKVAKKLVHLITVSKSSQTDIKKHFLRDANIIGNGVDTKVFKRNPNIEKISGRIITTTSSDQPIKGLKYLLEALGKIRDEFPHISLEIIGSLNADGECARLIKSLDLKKNIICSSQLSTLELVNRYSAAELFVCPSLYEGFGLPLAEAMACGLPVITTDGGALPEVVGESGIVVKAGNRSAIVEALQNLLRDNQRREYLSRHARQHILSHFCWQKVALDMTHFYRQIISNAND